ncbi:hypothetical protein RN001_012165 [Aquatica leii]|uniref:Uncharacterized protein n=1 Tax=Aquatica leii TaxID=1421715 RepID=A0AAN7SMC2_9COLE|nr:hypothetical protein RN001_012165 [Aquatica leii]
MHNSEKHSETSNRVAVAMLILFGIILTAFSICRTQHIIEAGIETIDPATTLDCHRRLYTYRVTQADENGKQCWDTLSVLSCWGRCDSNEISDWRFPYKKSLHPVCIHYGRNKVVAILRHCEEGIKTSRSHNDKQKFLCRVFDKERSSGNSLINLEQYAVSLDIQISEIKTTLNSVKTLTKEFEGSSSDSVYKRLKSIIAHATGRILRLIFPKEQSAVKNELYADVLLLDANLEDSVTSPETANTSGTFSNP